MAGGTERAADLRAGLACAGLTKRNAAISKPDAANVAEQTLSVTFHFVDYP
ncbi:hypothetical protein E05_42850 [Plautia stali symbiont]|nr:hypothetical protein E05_42850 [Plautia stali symbiont]